MVTEDQTAVVSLLSASSTHGGAAVDRIDTHASIVFLAGPHAWKLKRAVRYEYLDFSTADRRKASCEVEVRINRRTAGGLYLGVVPVTREASGVLALGGSGVPVDWLIHMARFDQDALFDRMAARGALAIDLMDPLASALAQFHAIAQPRTDRGGLPGMLRVVDGNATGLAEEGAGILDRSACDRLMTRTRAAVATNAALLEAQRTAGMVRECHGDLHLRNIVLLDGRPTIVDAIEFNDDIACIDVLYDLAFLLMDLWRRKLPRHANAVWNRYLFETRDVNGISLLPLFLSCRAAVRAKTSASAARLQSGSANRAELWNSARDYLALAEQLLRAAPPALIAVGGWSGSGKSTVAASLAPGLGSVPGAVVIRSDEVRKQLCGVGPLNRLGPDGYAAEVTVKVYAAIRDRAASAIRSGYAVIADAVYAGASDRSAIERVAKDANVPFAGLWLDAPERLRIARSEQRRHNPSDADAAVIRRQSLKETGPITWHRIDASAAPDVVLARAIAAVRDSGATPNP